MWHISLSADPRSGLCRLCAILSIPKHNLIVMVQSSASEEIPVAWYLLKRGGFEFCLERGIAGIFVIVSAQMGLPQDNGSRRRVAPLPVAARTNAAA